MTTSPPMYVANGIHDFVKCIKSWMHFDVKILPIQASLTYCIILHTKAFDPLKYLLKCIILLNQAF